jgi:DNA-binding IclR family transcriptional regulator
MPASNEKYFLGTLTKTFALLDLFKSHEELGLTEMSQYLSLSKSNVYRIVITLEHGGYLAKTKDIKYKLGTKLFYLGRLVLDRQELIPIARPLLRELMKKIGETTNLSIFSYDNAVTFIVKEVPDHSITLGPKIGMRLPAYTTADGKTLLAFSGPEFLDSYFEQTELRKRTENTIISEESLRKVFAQIRRQGYAEDLEETEAGLMCIAAPVYNIQGKVIAAVSIAGPEVRIAANRDFLARAIIETASQISRDMGSRQKISSTPFSA